MMTAIKNPKGIAIAATALCIASIIWLMSTQSVNNALEMGLEQEKLKSEALLSEKLLLEKDLEKMKGQLASLRGINSQLDEVVRNSEARLLSQEADLGKLRRQSASVSAVRKQREELLRLQRELENELTAIKASYADLENENRMLSNNIAQLQDRNALLMSDLNKAMSASIDRAQLQAVKGKKERLTVRARRTQKLIADFEIPASLKNISFRIVDPKGEVLSDKQGNVFSHVTSSDENLIASATASAHDTPLQKVNMQFVPKQRLQPGVYKVEILNENLYVSSLNVKLR